MLKTLHLKEEEITIKDSSSNVLGNGDFTLNQINENSYVESSTINWNSSERRLRNLEIVLNEENIEEYRINTSYTNESCFNFTNEMITGYYEYENNDQTQPLCPKEIAIPDTINKCGIGEYAFYEKGLTSATIPASVTSIGLGTFADNHLATVTIPSLVTTIGKGAFTYNNLKTIIIPNSVVSINEHAFSNNDLTEVTISDSVMSIKRYAFINNKLTKVIIEGKTSSSEFTTYNPNWTWNNNVTCVINNTSNVQNGCIIWDE